ncbi:hypothetical protein PsYK624_039740 [Phanerochaete sordida]|uniref:SprT-like domain-containing protein n=1 Tax=Phanerochaete sordida TaxID=48140 RepID=A0A9P3G4V7_9APHY|nr:hypothetical protein PsYK624_039740 [Phanerochaete sordida]
MPNLRTDIFGDTKAAQEREVPRAFRGVSPAKSPRKKLTEVVVVSSDEDDIPVSPRKAVRPTPILPKQTKASFDLKPTAKGPFGPFRPARTPSAVPPASEMPIAGLQSKGAPVSSSDASSGIQEEEQAPVPCSPVKTSRHCDDDIIDLTLDSSESGDDESETDKREVISLIDDSPHPPRRLLKGSRLLAELDKLSLDDTPTPRKPVSQPALDLGDDSDSAPAPKPAAKASRRRWVQSSSESGSEADVQQTTAPPRHAPTRPGIRAARSPSPDRPVSPELSPPPSPTKKGKAPRVTKKAQREAEQARREAYAEQLFKELNASVFKGGLPEATPLKWSVRLLTTAGRAKWRKSRDGTQTTEIELATKILDSDDRIRNTLSHEMCHLACWIIDGDPKEGHGRAFKSWYVPPCNGSCSRLGSR